MKKILILGGTGFVGRILTENLLAGGASVTLFNRGKRNPDIFPEAKKIYGDRNTDDIEKLKVGEWDAVIDFSCMFPDSLDRITDLLKGKVKRYIFVSTVSVYPMENPDFWKSPVNEDAEVLSCTPEQRTDPDVMSTYGNKKAECERVLLGKNWLDSIIFRPGLIYGRYDPTDRFYYWIYKIHSQEEVLLPDEGRDKFNSTYSEDFAGLIEAATVVDKHSKIYNAVTHKAVTIKHFLEIASELLAKRPRFINATTDFLGENNIQAWSDLPIWLHGMDLVVDYSRAITDFPVKMHDFKDSVKGCIDYYSSLNWPVPRYGISAEKEAELLKKLKTV
jgi:2'-hydroxyisoflavone reductase